MPLKAGFTAVHKVSGPLIMKSLWWFDLADSWLFIFLKILPIKTIGNHHAMKSIGLNILKNICHLDPDEASLKAWKTEEIFIGLTSKIYGFSAWPDFPSISLGGKTD